MAFRCIYMDQIRFSNRKLKKKRIRQKNTRGIDGIVRLALLLLVFGFHKLLSFAFKSNYISKRVDPIAVPWAPRCAVSMSVCVFTV
jgi:hypothetical protein